MSDDKEQSMISLQKVSLTLPGPKQSSGKKGKDVTILQEISLDVQTGETVSITGPSGSGKTSLMMVIAGVEKSTGGEVTIAGQTITGLDEDQLAAFRRDHVGVVFQNFHLIPTMTALENVSVGLELAGRTDALERAKEGLDMVGLSHRHDHYPEQLSGGEQQRTALARAFATRPPLLLADEPTGNLDTENGEHIMELLLQMREKYGTTLVLITHDRALAKRTSRQLSMKSGVLTDVTE